MEIASWNVNSIRARLEHVTTWLKARQPDVLLLQELKGTEFPADVFKKLGYESVAVTQKAYNGVAILSRHPIKTISTTLAGDEADSHSRFLEAMIEGIRIVNIYLPNGNPVGSDNFAYKLAWMERLRRARYAEAVFHTAHHCNVPVPTAVHHEVPPRNENQPRTGLAVKTGGRREVHILADRHAPLLVRSRQQCQGRSRLQVRLERGQHVLLIITLHI